MARSVVIKEIPRKKLDQYEDRGWKVIGVPSRTICRIRKKLSKWERFEVQMRELFQKAEFEQALDPYEFWYDDLGNQVDVCGGVGEHFIIVDCTSKIEAGFRGLKDKVADTQYKMPTLTRGVQSVFRGKYKQVHYVICTEDVDQSPKEVQEAWERGIRVIDRSILDQWRHVANILGPAIRYQILETLAEEKIPIEGSKEPFRFRALQIIAHPVEDEKLRYAYIFAIDPETLLKLAVVYRLKYMNPAGYQRDLKPGKLRLINEYLSDWNHAFPNSILVAFDQEGTHRLKFRPDEGTKNSPVRVGWVFIPRLHSIAEIIDGQHRLYGYVDFTKTKQFDNLLVQRRERDRLIVVAIPDPAGTQRPELYLSINSTQTKISTRQIWTLMGETRPTSKMGYVSNVVRALNEHGVFQDSIEIPRVTRGHRSINIANFGKGISDRHLIDRSGEEFSWNLWKGPRIEGPYPKVVTVDDLVVQQLDLFFKCARDLNTQDWDRRVSFLRSNNGVNVLLRLLVEILKYYPNKVLTAERIKRILKPVLRRYVNEYGAEDLLPETSAEVGREKHAREIMLRINKSYPGFAREYLEQARKRRRRR